MTSDSPSEHHRSLRRAAVLTAALGAAHAVLLLLSYALLSGVPEQDASDAEIVAFYSSSDRRLLVLVCLYLMPFAGIAFLWFIVALRTWIAHSVARENALIANVQLVSGIVFIVTTSNIGRTTGILLRWFTWTGFGVGLFLLLSGSFYPALIIVFPVWLLTLSGLLLVRARRIPADAALTQVRPR